MANEERVLKTRIALLYKEYSDWQAVKDTYTPLRGEVCICEVPAGSGSGLQEPCVLIKVGDGESTFGELSWTSALAADVYGWAKKENLIFDDLSQAFLEKLDQRIRDKSSNTEYQMIGSNGVWKLQKREIGSEEWTDVSTVDVASYVTPLLNKKVDKEIIGDSGKSLIFNESDGGGAKFEHNDGTWSYVGVHNGGESGIAAQIYAVDSKDNYKGAKIDVTKGGVYYTVGSAPASQRMVPDNELVTRKDIVGGVHFIGVGEYRTGVEIEELIKPVYAAKGKSYENRQPGDIVILQNNKDPQNPISKEYICDSSKQWVELGDGSIYATKDELKQEASVREATDNFLQTSINLEKDARVLADTTLQTNIDNEATTRQTADEALQSGLTAEATAREQADTSLQANIDAEAQTRAAADTDLNNRKVEKEITSSQGKAIIFNESDGGGAKFENSVTKIESYVGVHNGVDSGIVAQIYADKLVDGKWQGAKLDVTNNGIYYTVGNQSASERDIDANKLAVKGELPVRIPEEDLEELLK